MNQRPILESGSFRDPSGSIFYYRDCIFRNLDDDAFCIFKRLEDVRIIESLQEKGYIVSSKSISDNEQIYHELKEFFPQANNFVEHQKISFISYPYEWSFSMLAEAAMLYLKLQICLIKNGYSLKDASAFNIQFINGKPIFIDLASIEMPSRKDIWIAYGQFHQMFLFPLLLYKFKKIDLKSCFISNINGVTLDYVYGIFGFWGSLRPSLCLDVFVQYILGKIAQKNTDMLKRKIDKSIDKPDVQLFNLKRLLRKIEKLSRFHKRPTHWLRYTFTHSYSDRAELEKKRYVRDFFKTHKLHSVLDLGCNTGEYSLIAAESGADVVAVDSDHDCVDYLYRYVKENKKTVLPLYMDIANPSPPTGFNNQERKSFMSRVRCDCVLALALAHHLLITSRIPLASIRDLLYNLTNEYLIFEFVPPGDSMFQRLLGLRKNIYTHLDTPYLLSVFSEKFDLLDRKPIGDTKRTLFTFKKKNEG